MNGGLQSPGVSLPSQGVAQHYQYTPNQSRFQPMNRTAGTLQHASSAESLQSYNSYQAYQHFAAHAQQQQMYAHAQQSSREWYQSDSEASVYSSHDEQGSYAGQGHAERQRLTYQQQLLPPSHQAMTSQPMHTRMVGERNGASAHPTQQMIHTQASHSFPVATRHVAYALEAPTTRDDSSAMTSHPNSVGVRHNSQPRPQFSQAPHLMQQRQQHTPQQQGDQ